MKANRKDAKDAKDKTKRILPQRTRRTRRKEEENLTTKAQSLPSTTIGEHKEKL
jgi:hypothetical protein